MDGWQDQTSGMGGTGWMPLYMMGNQMGYGQGQPSQTQLGPNGSAPPLGASPPGQGAPQFQGPGTAPQFPNGPQTPGYGMGASAPPMGTQPLGSSTQGVPSPQLPQGTAQGFTQGYGKPLSMSNFLPQQGRQIMGNPTSTFVGQGGITSALSGGQYD